MFMGASSAKTDGLTRIPVSLPSPSMKARLLSYVAAGLAAALLSSCSAANSMYQYADRMAQAASRSAGLAQ
jgi:hypothetical protein